jgi:hypothetical protein
MKKTTIIPVLIGLIAITITSCCKDATVTPTPLDSTFIISDKKWQLSAETTEGVETYAKAIKLPAGLISIDNQILIYKQLGVPPHLSQYIQ